MLQIPFPHIATTIALVALGMAGPAHAKQINFSGTVEVGCTLIVDDGTLVINSFYSQLSSDQVGGNPARLTVTTVGGTAKLSLSAPQWAGAAPANALPPEIKFRSNRGKVQEYTDQATDPISIGGTGDLLLLHARADNPIGFQAGDYTITTTATCSG